MMESQEFFEEVKRLFSFLVRDHGFSEPILEVDPQIHYPSVVFMGKNLAVELELDPRDEWVDCKIAQVIDGRKTEFYAVNEKGERVRDDLEGILDRQGIHYTERAELRRGMPFEEEVRRLLAEYATVLKKYGQEILRDSPSIFS